MHYNHFWYDFGLFTLFAIVVLVLTMLAIEIYRYGLCNDPVKYARCKYINVRLYAVTITLLLLNLFSLALSLHLN